MNTVTSNAKEVKKRYEAGDIFTEDKKHENHLILLRDDENYWLVADLKTGQCGPRYLSQTSALIYCKHLGTQAKINITF